MNLHLLLAASSKAEAATTGCSTESLEGASFTTEREKTEQGEQTEASTTTAATTVVNGGAIVGAAGCIERRIQTRCTGTVDCCIDNADGGHDNQVRVINRNLSREISVSEISQW